MDPERVLRWVEPEIGLEAVLVIDSTVLGPAAGGMRTRSYASLDEAEADARILARAMTLKCSLAGLDAGGAKLVIRKQAGWDRARVFRRVGELVQGLDGAFRTAGDLGTTADDLGVAAEVCEYVHTEEDDLAAALARGYLACARALCRHRGRSVEDCSIAVQGCGAIGAAIARELAQAGASLVLADIDTPTAERLAVELGAELGQPESILGAEVDILCPCAVGEVITLESMTELRAWGLCGAANHIIADRATELALTEAGIRVVPDFLASAGAVIRGVGRSVMELADTEPLILALEQKAELILEGANEQGRTTSDVAREMALAQLAH